MRLLLAIIALSLVAQAVIVGFQIRSIESSRTEAKQQSCLAIAKLDNTLIGLIRSSEKTLPTLAYYKTHPQDLVKALGDDENAITALSPPKFC